MDTPPRRVPVTAPTGVGVGKVGLAPGVARREETVRVGRLVGVGVALPVVRGADETPFRADARPPTANVGLA